MSLFYKLHYFSASQLARFIMFKCYKYIWPSWLRIKPKTNQAENPLMNHSLLYQLVAVF